MSAAIYHVDGDMFDAAKPFRMQQIKRLIFANVNVRI